MRLLQGGYQVMLQLLLGTQLVPDTPCWGEVFALLLALRARLCERDDGLLTLLVSRRVLRAIRALVCTLLRCHSSALLVYICCLAGVALRLRLRFVGLALVRLVVPLREFLRSHFWRPCRLASGPMGGFL